MAHLSSRHIYISLSTDLPTCVPAYLPVYLSICCYVNTEAKHFHYVNEVLPTQGLSLLSGKAINVVSDLIHRKFFGVSTFSITEKYTSKKNLIIGR